MFRFLFSFVSRLNFNALILRNLDYAEWSLRILGQPLPERNQSPRLSYTTT